jgi:hypothetical protein
MYVCLFFVVLEALECPMQFCLVLINKENKRVALCRAEPSELTARYCYFLLLNELRQLDPCSIRLQKQTPRGFSPLASTTERPNNSRQ